LLELPDDEGIVFFADPAKELKDNDKSGHTYAGCSEHPFAFDVPGAGEEAW